MGNQSFGAWKGYLWWLPCKFPIPSPLFLPTSRCSMPSQLWFSEPNRRTWHDSNSRMRLSKSTSPKRNRLSRNAAEWVAPIFSSSTQNFNKDWTGWKVGAVSSRNSGHMLESWCKEHEGLWILAALELCPTPQPLDKEGCQDRGSLSALNPSSLQWRRIVVAEMSS